MAVPARADVLSPAEINAALGFAEQQADKTMAALPNTSTYPRCCGDSGAWSTVGIADWTSGFFPLELASLYRATGATQWLTAATAWTLPLAPEATLGQDADIGMRMQGFGALYSLTGNPAYASVLVQAGATLAARYNPLVGGIDQYDTPGTFTLLEDGMNDMKPLEFGATHGGSAGWLGIAAQNALTVAANLIRPNGSTYQMALFDPTTGQQTFLGTMNGYSNTSDWQRGLAWAINGYADLYDVTRNAQFLSIAEQLANHFIAVLPSDCVPYWDADDPSIPGAPRDTSAGALGDLGLTKLAVLAGGTAGAGYEAAAQCGLSSLISNYLAPNSSEAVLTQGNAPDGSDVALIYGDASFVEALAAQQYMNQGLSIAWTMSDAYLPLGTEVPEPSAWTLLAAGVAALRGLRGRRNVV
jgi:unsaturated chondroitin disaccharide hydrolase